MWAGWLVMGALAQGIPELDAETGPEAAPETGTLLVVATEAEVDSWAESLWEAAVKKANRRWRRASRKSDEPIPPPEVPRPEVEGVPHVLLVVTGEALEASRERHTDADGAASLVLPVGVYTLEVVPPDGPSRTVDGIQVKAGATKRLVVPVEEWSETDVVTWLPPEPQPVAMWTPPPRFSP